MNRINQIILEGSVKEVKVVELITGRFASVVVAYDMEYKDRYGDIQVETCYFDIECRGPLVDSVERLQGREDGKCLFVRIIGRLVQRQWKDSSAKSHSKVVVIAEHIEEVQK